MQPIRLARRADAAEIAAMSRDQIEQGLGWSWNEARVLRAIEARDTNVAVAADTGKLTAFGIMVYRDDTAHLMLFSVRPEHRRRGVGRELLRWLEAVALTAGIERISLECRRENAPARNFYADQGYHEMAIHKGYYRGVEDAVRLEKWISTRETK
jgi:[ribosomal protein S18]-alanine N-acetyltransferase